MHAVGRRRQRGLDRGCDRWIGGCAGRGVADFLGGRVADRLIERLRGVEMMLQALPSQCCVCMRPLPSTAQTSADPMAATDVKTELREKLEEMAQALPFQCSVIVEPALVSGFC